MRKYLILAVVALVAMVLPNAASAQDGVQSIVTKVTPNKLEKKKFKPVTLFVDVITANNDEDTSLEQPPSADRTRVDFSKNLKFDTKAVPNCDVTNADLDNTSSQEAIDLCGKATVVSVPGPDPAASSPTNERDCAGPTCATVIADLAPNVPGGILVVPVKVTALNGNAKDQIYLHSRAEDLGVTSVLIGKLTKGEAGFGNTLDVTIPDLDAGAIADFKTTVKAGKYVQGTCKDKTPTYRARTDYSNHSSTSDDFTTTCKQKKPKKKKGGGGKGGK